ncbi:hypothetical protein P879_09396 [Paragonimus westermani]|uniref:Selenide, water dikinase n=1 Tax=Paragonimus westermani TaxID=34504 RepID=A0A8T0DB88_9TREM|nr:hypothetical protein P879_09396 [Paragonimus westermani]
MSLELDCCVLPLRNNLKLIQTTDFFYPLIDDPYTMGWITCCNVLSDLYAMGVVDCDNMLLLLGVAQEMTANERKVAIQLLIQGFRDCALQAGTSIRGGQTVLSPWLLVGGVATAVCSDAEYIMPNQAEKGDVLVLTKPLGTQVAVNVYQWMLDDHTFWRETLKNITTNENVRSLFHAATMSMTHLNRTAARLMHKYGAHGCTDVTGFGLMGHAENLVKFQKNSKLAFKIHSLPCLASTVQLSKALNDRFKLFKGLCPETSGGLLVILPSEAANGFCEELERLEGCPAWIIGDVMEAESRTVTLLPEPNFIDVDHSSIAAPKRGL